MSINVYVSGIFYSVLLFDGFHVILSDTEIKRTLISKFYPILWKGCIKNEFVHNLSKTGTKTPPNYIYKSDKKPSIKKLYFSKSKTIGMFQMLYLATFLENILYALLIPLEGEMYRII